MKTILNISWDRQDSSFPRNHSARIPVVANESFGSRRSPQGCGRDPDGDLSSLVHLLDAAGARPRALVSAGGLMSLMTLLLDDGSLAKLTTDGESAVLQDWFKPRNGMDTTDPKQFFIETMRAMIVRHAEFEADGKAMAARPAGDYDKKPENKVSFVHPERWGFSEGLKWGGTGQAINQTIAGGAGMIRPRTSSLFTEVSNAGRGDPLHLTDQLRQIRDQAAQAVPKLRQRDEQEAGRMCYRLALALGRCRLFGAEIDEPLDGTLEPEIALSAAEHVMSVLQSQGDQVLAFDQPQEASVYRAEDARLEALEARMDAWAVFLALDESYMTAIVESDSSASALSKRLSAVMDQVERFDGNLRDRSSRLQVAASTRMLANWRRLLAPDYREMLPWWLSGELE